MNQITAIVLRPVEIDITKLAKSDFKLLDKEKVVVIAVGLIEVLKIKEQEITALEQQLGKQAEAIKAVKAVKAVNDTKVAPIAKKTVVVAPTPKEKDGTTTGKSVESTVGFKHGVTSKYHYVSFNKKARKKPWQAALKINRKQINKYFTTELAAAVAVDLQLDFMEDEKRPRNRDEFPEVAEAYRAQEKK